MFRTNSCKADEITTKNKENRKEDSNDSDININISRKLFNQPEFSEKYPSNEFIGFSIIYIIKSLFIQCFNPSKKCTRKFIKNRIPAIQWIRHYKKEYILPDILAGMTV